MKLVKSGDLSLVSVRSVCQQGTLQSKNLHPKRKLFNFISVLEDIGILLSITPTLTHTTLLVGPELKARESYSIHPSFFQASTILQAL